MVGVDLEKILVHCNQSNISKDNMLYGAEPLELELFIELKLQIFAAAVITPMPMGTVINGH